METFIYYLEKCKDYVQIVLEYWKHSTKAYQFDVTPSFSHCTQNHEDVLSQIRAVHANTTKRLLNPDRVSKLQSYKTIKTQRILCLQNSPLTMLLGKKLIKWCKRNPPPDTGIFSTVQDINQNLGKPLQAWVQCLFVLQELGKETSKILENLYCFFKKYFW